MKEHRRHLHGNAKWVVNRLSKAIGHLDDNRLTEVFACKVPVFLVSWELLNPEWAEIICNVHEVDPLIYPWWQDHDDANRLPCRFLCGRSNRQPSKNEAYRRQASSAPNCQSGSPDDCRDFGLILFIIFRSDGPRQSWNPGTHSAGMPEEGNAYLWIYMHMRKD